MKTVNVRWLKDSGQAPDPASTPEAYLGQQLGGLSPEQYLDKQFKRQGGGPAGAEPLPERYQELGFDPGRVRVRWLKPEKKPEAQAPEDKDQAAEGKAGGLMETYRKLDRGQKNPLGYGPEGVVESMVNTLILAPMTSVASGLAGLPALLGGDPDKSADIMRRTQEEWAYKPKTEIAKQVEKNLGAAMTWWHDLLDKSEQKRQEAIAKKADDLIRQGKLAPDDREAYVSTLFGNVQTAIKQGFHDLIPGMMMKRARSALEGEPAPSARGVKPPLEGEYQPRPEGSQQQAPGLGVDPIEGSAARPPTEPTSGIGHQKKLMGPADQPARMSVERPLVGPASASMEQLQPAARRTPVAAEQVAPDANSPAPANEIQVSPTQAPATKVTKQKVEDASRALSARPNKPRMPIEFDIYGQTRSSALGVSPQDKLPMSQAKAELKAKVDELIQQAPTHGNERVKIEIPGDGRFVVKNNKARLQEFSKKIDKTFVSKKPFKPRTDPGSASRFIEESLKEGAHENAYNAALASNNPLRYGRSPKGEAVPYHSVSSVDLGIGHDAFVGKSSDKDPGRRWVVVLGESGVSLIAGPTKEKAVSQARLKLKQAGIEFMNEKIANLENIGQRTLEQRYVEAFQGAPGKSPKGGLGGRQGGAVSLEPLADLVEGARHTIRETGSILDAVGRSLFYSSAQSIRDIGTPTAHRIADLFRAPLINKTGQPVPPDYFQRRDIIVGRFMQQLSDALAPAENRFGRLGKTRNDALVAALRGDYQTVGDMANTVAELRGYLDKVRQYAVDSGLMEPGYIENYFPRMYDPYALARKKDQFLAVLQKHGISRDAAESIAYTIIQNDGFGDFQVQRSVGFQDDGGWVGRVGRAFGAEGFASKNANLDHSRKLKNIPDSELAPFMDNDLKGVLARYTHGVAKRVEYARSFGKNEEKLNQMVEDLVKEARQQHSPLSPKEIYDRVYNLADAAQNKYRPIQHKGIEKINRATIGYEVISKLGLVSLTSLVENMAILATSSPGTTLPALAKALTHSVVESAAAADKLITGKRHIPKLQMTMTAEEMGLIMSDALESSAANVFSLGTGRLTQKFMRLVLQEQVTNFSRVFAQQTGLKIIERNGRYLQKHATGKKANDYRRQLIEMGVTPEEAVNLHVPLNAAKAKFAATRWSNWVSQNPNAGSLPLWMSDPHMAHLALFKKFSASFTNTFLKKFTLEMKHSERASGKLKLAASAFVLTLAAYYMQYLRDFIGWGTGENPYNKDQTKPERLAAAIDRSGMSGNLTWLYALLQPRYGFADMGERRVLNLFGPMMTDTARMIGAATDPENKKMAKELARMTPGLNIHKPTRSWLEDAYLEALSEDRSGSDGVVIGRNAAPGKGGIVIK